MATWRTCALFPRRENNHISCANPHRQKKNCSYYPSDAEVAFPWRKTRQKCRISSKMIDNACISRCGMSSRFCMGNFFFGVSRNHQVRTRRPQIIAERKGDVKRCAHDNVMKHWWNLQKFKGEEVSTLKGPFSAVSPNLPGYRFIPTRSRRDLGVCEERNQKFIEKMKKKSGRKLRFFGRFPLRKQCKPHFDQTWGQIGADRPEIWHVTSPKGEERVCKFSASSAFVRAPLQVKW